MSYKVEITAGSVTELAGKLLALAATMQAVPHDPIMPEVKAAETPKPSRAKKPGKAEEASETPVGEPAADAAETGSSPSDTAAAQPETTVTTETASLTDNSSENSASDRPALDFDKDVTPVVLGAVKAKGREWVSSVLSQFGAERASQVPEEQFGELIAALQDGGPEA